MLHSLYEICKIDLKQENGAKWKFSDLAKVSSVHQMIHYQNVTVGHRCDMASLELVRLPYCVCLWLQVYFIPCEEKHVYIDRYARSVSGVGNVPLH